MSSSDSATDLASKELERTQEELGRQVGEVRDFKYDRDRTLLDLSKEDQDHICAAMDYAVENLYNWKLDDEFERQTLLACPQVSMAMIYMSKALKCIATATAHLHNGNYHFPEAEECFATESDHWSLKQGEPLIHQLMGTAIDHFLREEGGVESDAEFFMVKTQFDVCKDMTRPTLLAGGMEDFSRIDDRTPHSESIRHPAWAMKIHTKAQELGLRGETDSHRNHLPLDFKEEHFHSS
jgi:hypothetical protein